MTSSLGAELFQPVFEEFPMSRLIALIYGLASYALFILTFLYAIGFVGGFVVPKTINSGEIAPLSAALANNLRLLSLFAIQHSVMARKSFKAWWTQYVPASVERSTYVLFASLTLDLLFWQWQAIPSVIWQIDQPEIAIAISSLAFGGWLIVLTSTFLISHFELFGVHQVVNNLGGKELPPPRFRTPFLYNLVRHPIYLGFLIAFWATPVMTAGHLLFAGATTIYVLIGIMLEERDLTAMFGDDYRRYRDRVSMLLPWRSGLTQARKGHSRSQPSSEPAE
jgi:protein-S-isoprenylcysteine O-methyltransferase Ste14